MANEQQPATPAATPAPGTDGTPPAATQPAPAAGATTVQQPEVPAGYKLIKEDDLKNLQSQRDRANEGQRQVEDYVNSLAQKEGIDKFLTENADKYPHLKRDDLLHIDDPDKLAAEADRLERRFQDSIQDALHNAQNIQPPTISPEDKAKRLESLKKNPSKTSFGEMVKLKLQPTK